jgi:hypothetical protein
VFASTAPALAALIAALGLAVYIHRRLAAG